jgi:hypothetical protein
LSWVVRKFGQKKTSETNNKLSHSAISRPHSSQFPSVLPPTSRATGLRLPPARSSPPDWPPRIAAPHPRGPRASRDLVSPAPLSRASPHRGRPPPPITRGRHGAARRRPFRPPRRLPPVSSSDPEADAHGDEHAVANVATGVAKHHVSDQSRRSVLLRCRCG